MRANFTPGKPANFNDLNYLKSAPAKLITLHRKRQSAGYSASELGRLLTDLRMQRPWRVLSRRVKTDKEWHRLLIHIDLCLDEAFESRLPKAAQQRHFLQIARMASTLSHHLDIELPGLKTIDLYPADVRRALGLPALLTSIGLAGKKKLLAERWPSVADLLRNLELKAKTWARDISLEDRWIKRVRNRIDGRKHMPPELRAFVRALATTFRQLLNSPLYGTTAAIAGVIFQTTDVTTKFVQKANKRRLNHPPKP